LGKSRHAAAPLLSYDPNVFALIRHAMAAFYPQTDDLPGVEDTGIDRFLRRFYRESSRLMWLGLVAGSLVFALTPIITVFWPLPSFLLPSSVLDRHAYRVTYSKLYLVRQSTFIVKLVAGLCWGSDPRIRAVMAMEPYPEDPGTYRIN